MSESIDASSFLSLKLPAPLHQALQDLGYETPSPIQQHSIPHLLAGKDLLGQAQTGTGKTAAFALPLLARLNLQSRQTQVLVLAPTRELAIQVAEAFQSYARHLKGFSVLPLYGGQSYDGQLRQLKRGAQVVVGTPGRTMDHMRKGTLKLDGLQAIVLDEADEMLRMGFIDDVEWILEKAPTSRQTALFSATMPPQIARVAKRYLKDPIDVHIKTKTTTAKTIRQRYWLVEGLHKLDALTRLLEAEPTEGMIIFVRTKTATVELAEKLTARGYACDALNGDIPQAQRERIVERLKKGKLDIAVATDVAARGLDVQRISHVINYDIPYDTEAYVHRIGRTGRAGRTGDAILFVARRERRMLRSIEKATGQPIEPLVIPTAKDINAIRLSAFKDRISQTIAEQDLSFYHQLISEYIGEAEQDPIAVSAALAQLLQGDAPMFLSERPAAKIKRHTEEADAGAKKTKRTKERKHKSGVEDDNVPKECFRLEVGRSHGVKPGNIVGAIANEAELDSEYIGGIEIKEDYSTVYLPTGMPDEVLKVLQNAHICQQRMGLKRWADEKADGAPSKEGVKHKHQPRKRRSEVPAKSKARDPRGKQNNKGKGRDFKSKTKDVSKKVSKL